jgi:hypothetical protein
MADPTGYTVSYSFAGFQANSPTAPLPGPSVDNEFDNVATAIASLISAIKGVRRSDGALQNNIVTFDSLAQGLQLTFDPTNGSLVAAAVATAQAAQAAASGSAGTAGASATAAAGSAAAAAASAGTVNLTLYLPKAGNLAGLGSPATARANLSAANVDGSDMVGRLASATGFTVTDWNLVTTSGWFGGNSAANGPPGLTQLIVNTISFSPLWTQQLAYPFTLATSGLPPSTVTPFRRYSFDNGGVAAWTPWESVSSVPVGSTIWVNGPTAPPGFLKENGALLARTSYPALYDYAVQSGNICTEAVWSPSFMGAFTNGDLATTFRIPDSRGVFTRGFDDSRGVDSGRILGAYQLDTFKDHAHAAQFGATITVVSAAGASVLQPGAVVTGNVSAPNGGGTETRPRNNAKLACIKY